MLEAEKLHGHLIGQQGSRRSLNTPALVLDLEMLDRNDAFFRREVRQQRCRHHVADCIDTLLGRLLILINLDETSLDFDLRFF